MREKGKEYFENWEVTGSKKADRDGTPKFALTDWLDGHIMPELNALCRELEQRYNMRIYVRGQGDNATPHCEKVFVQHMRAIFDARGWDFTYQPPNSPTTNNCDAAVFPSMAKEGSALQGILNGSRYLNPDKLWEVLQAAWEKYPEDRIARTFVFHSQIAAAIYKCEGGDEFNQERNGLSFGVRKVCRPWFGDDDDGGGDSDLDLTSLTPRQLSTARGVVVEEVIEGVDVDAARKLKYDVSDMRQYDIGEWLTSNELDLIAGNPDEADYDVLSDDEKARYNEFHEAWHDSFDRAIVE